MVLYSRCPLNVIVNETACHSCVVVVQFSPKNVPKRGRHVMSSWKSLIRTLISARFLNRWISTARNFHACTHVNFTRISEVEAVHGRSRVHVKDEPCKRFSWAGFNFYVSAWPSMHCLYFIYGRKIDVRARVKTTGHWNPPIQKSHRNHCSYERSDALSLMVFLLG